MKKKLTLYVDSGLIEKAKAMGFNLSKLFEACLLSLTTNGASSLLNLSVHDIKIGAKSSCPGRDLNPRRGIESVENNKNPSSSPLEEEEVKVSLKDLGAFAEFLKITRGIEDTTVKDYVMDLKRFLFWSNWKISKRLIEKYILIRREKGVSPATLKNDIICIRLFARDFLRRPEWVAHIKQPKVIPTKRYTLPSREQLKKAFKVLKNDRERALFLFAFSTGLRKGEIMALRVKDVDFKQRAVFPPHFTTTKRGGISFFNEECEYYLKRYLSSRGRLKPEDRLFEDTHDHYASMWKRASKACGVKLSFQVARVWFAVEMRMRGVPDSFIDLMQGRQNHTVLSRYYSPVGVKQLKRIYEKANLKILE